MSKFLKDISKHTMQNMESSNQDNIKTSRISEKIINIGNRQIEFVQFKYYSEILEEQRKKIS